MGSKNKTSKRDKKEVNDSSQVREDIGNRRGDSGKKDVVTDPRFSHVHYDPRFARARKQKTKVAIDSRFNRMFTDKNFSSSSAQVDKRGKPKPKKKDGENPLKHYYSLEDDEGRIKEVSKESKSESDNDEANDESESESDDNELKRLKGKVQETGSEDEEDDDEDEGVDEDVESDDNELKRLKGKVQETGSEDEEDDDEDESVDEDVESDRSSADTTDTTDSDDEEEIYSMEHDNVEQVENVPEIDKETHRLAVVNLDWNHVRAVDIFMLFTSFLPKGGKMLSVSIYPSEFGLKRMEEEAVRGPVGLFDDDDAKKDDIDDDDDDDDNDEIDDDKLRAYELSRLRYYYAVVECDSVATADYLYKTCDGLEFERSSNKMDLRFIPDSMEFKHPPRDVATEAPSKYEGMDFHSKALQLSKIELTWDEDEPQRSKSLKRKFNADQLADMELKEFLASDDSESDSDDGDDDDKDDIVEHKPEKKRKKQELYRALLQSGEGSDEDDDDNNKGDMEVTFNTGLEELSKRHLEKKDKESETVWEAYLRKKKEKKKSKKIRSKNSSDDESSGYDDEPRQDHADDFFIEEPTVDKVDKKEKKQKGAVDEAEAGRAELELLLANDDGEINTGLKGYNMKPKKKSKGKKGNKNSLEEIQEDGKLPNVDYEDPRFSSLFTSPLFALDPTDPQFKRSAVYARQLAQNQGKSGREEKGAKQKQNKEEVPEPIAAMPTVENDNLKSEESSKKKDKLELSSLVKSLKMKSQQFQLPSTNKLSSNAKARKKGF
ncbi:pre-rRNA-processing protein esf1 [Impatiens glandulifera]|uniref:pre-rRNA-processing protein esf1 n=1 Tax=Impatiens glandulifera TaxID=253017 RepID=UPI001FB05B57|nr:pre-rRNA-processing protein esf1 [Impatiens glandulifera]